MQSQCESLVTIGTSTKQCISEGDLHAIWKNTDSGALLQFLCKKHIQESRESGFSVAKILAVSPRVVGALERVSELPLRISLSLEIAEELRDFLQQIIFTVAHKETKDKAAKLHALIYKLEQR